ncbi:MAG: C45 family peptidase [Actinomycetota bacterium]|nr:C45 family peptidase [Actinomycetota bacterium]
MSVPRVVRAEGDPSTRGRTIGRELGELIERSLSFYHSYFERRGVASTDLQDLLSPYLHAAEVAFPEHMATLKGMAEGAMVPVWELFAVNAFEELDPLLTREEGKPGFLDQKEGAARTRRRGAAERCSSFAVTGPGFTLLGHNEHWIEGDRGNVAVVMEVPERDRAVASPTVVCCLAAVGMNDKRGTQGIQSLRAADERPGVPRVLVSRHSLESTDRLDAVRRTAIRSRGGGYGYTFAFPGGDAFTIETTATRDSLLEGPGPHTNHYLDPSLAQMASEPSEGSLSRYERLLELLEDRQPDTPEAIMEMLADHKGAPNSVCLHPNPEDGDEASAVLFSMVCDVETGRMWVAAGNPCMEEFEEIDLRGTVERGAP